MVFTQIVPLLAIVIFWMIIFVFVFWFFNRSQNVPREEEPGASFDELHPKEQEHEGQEGAPIEVDDHIPSTPGR